MERKWEKSGQMEKSEWEERFFWEWELGMAKQRKMLQMVGRMGKGERKSEWNYEMNSERIEFFVFFIWYFLVIVMFYLVS